MTSLLLCYAAALVLFVAAFIGTLFFIKRFLKEKPHWGMFFLGIIVAAVSAAAVVVLWMVTFRTENYYNTPFFRTMVGFVYLLLICLVRVLIVRGALFGNYREDKGYSFCLGFGAAPGLLLTAYLLIMLPVVAFNGLFNGPCTVAEEGYLTFADNTIITVFRPAAGHVSFALAFFFFTVMTVATGVLLRKVTQQRCRPGVPVIWTILAVMLEAGAILPIPFFSMYGLQHWHLPLIVGILATVLVLLARFVPEAQEEATYTKQFE